MGDNTKSGIWLSQLFDVGNEHDCEIDFDGGCYLGGVRDDIRRLAVNRCYEMLRGRKERVNMLNHDSKPPPPTSSE